MIFSAKNESTRADRRNDAGERENRFYVEPSPCVVMPAVDLAALVPTRFSHPRTIHEYLT